MSKEESGAFQYAASQPNALGEARRVLGPSGTIVIANWRQPQDWEAAAFGLVADDDIAHIPTVTLPHGEIFQQSVSGLKLKRQMRQAFNFDGPWWRAAVYARAMDFAMGATRAVQSQ